MSEWQECNAIVRALAAEILGVEPNSLDDAVPLVDYGMDSLHAMTLVVGLERQFAVTIDDDDLARLHTTSELTDFVVRRR